jgi:hypothetical protein
MILNIQNSSDKNSLKTIIAICRFISEISKYKKNYAFKYHKVSTAFQ